MNFIFRRANLVTLDKLLTPPMTTISVADISAATERRRASFVAPVRIRAIGELPNVRGLDEYDASGFNAVQRFGSPKSNELAEFLFYKKDRTVDWTSVDLEKQFPPDAIFSSGKFIKGEKLLPRR